jgi:hypothetical protein
MTVLRRGIAEERTGSEQHEYKFTEELLYKYL